MKIPKTKKAYGPAVKRNQKTARMFCIESLFGQRFCNERDADEWLNILSCIGAAYEIEEIPKEAWIKRSLEFLLEDWDGYTFDENMAQLRKLAAM